MNNGTPLWSHLLLCVFCDSPSFRWAVSRLIDTCQCNSPSFRWAVSILIDTCQRDSPSFSWAVSRLIDARHWMYILLWVVQLFWIIFTIFNHYLRCGFWSSVIMDSVNKKAWCHITSGEGSKQKKIVEKEFIFRDIDSSECRHIFQCLTSQSILFSSGSACALIYSTSAFLFSFSLRGRFVASFENWNLCT